VTAGTAWLGRGSYSGVNFVRRSSRSAGNYGITDVSLLRASSAVRTGRP
jgi:hypothetical protein